MKRVVGEIVADISPFDVADSNVEDFEEKVEKLDKVSKNLAAKIYKLKSAVKAKKFRRNESHLESAKFVPSDLNPAHWSKFYFYMFPYFMASINGN